MITRPLLAEKITDMEKIPFPVLATPKHDGIRVLKISGAVVTRKFIDLPNVQTRLKLEAILPDGIDGEIMLRQGNFNAVQSGIMTRDGEPDYVFFAFDYVKESLDKPYAERIVDLQNWYTETATQFPWLLLGQDSTIPENFEDKVRLVLPTQINSAEELLQYESECLKLGFEGAVIRIASGKYKCGRSTEKECLLLKMTKFIDSEATVVGFTELMHNNNDKEKNKFGLSKRSSKKEGLVPAGTLGNLIVVDLITKIQFKVGTGFDSATRSEIWNNRDKYCGKIIKYKFRELGKTQKPRFPGFLGFRHIDDL